MSALAKEISRFVETEIEDETVVMLLESGDFFSLRDSAQAVWELIDGTRDRAAILAALGDAYDAPPEALAGDVDAFLAELTHNGLVR